MNRWIQAKGPDSKGYNGVWEHSAPSGVLFRCGLCPAVLALGSVCRGLLAPTLELAGSSIASSVVPSGAWGSRP